MARASSSSTKFASVNLNRSYGKPAAPASGGLSSGSATLGASGRARASPHGGMLLLSRPVRPQQPGPQQPGAVVQKGGKVIVPRPVNLPSLRREHAGNDPTIALVGGTGASGWTKTPQEEAPVATILPETTGMARLAPALSAGSTWGTSPSSVGGSISGEQWPVPTQAAATATNQAAVVRSGVYTPPRARSMLTPTPPLVNGHVVPTVEKAVVLRGEDFPTLQAALPPPPVPPQQRQKNLHQKQREKQQELKDQQQKLQQLSEQHSVLKPDEVPQSQLGGPQLQPAQPLSAQAKSEQISKISKEESQSLEQQGSTGSGLSARPSAKADNHSIGPPLPGPRQQRQSNWTDDERDSAPSFRPQGGSYLDWGARSDREPEPRHINRAGDDFGYGRPLPHREVQPSFAPGRDASSLKDVEGRDNSYGGDKPFGRETHNTGGYGGDNGFNRGNNAGREGGFNREGGFREWGGGFNRDSGFGGRGFNREGNRDFGPNRESGYDREGGYARSNRDGFYDRQGFGNRDGGPNRDAIFNRDGGFNRDNFHGRDNRRPQGGEHDAGRGRFGDRFMRNGGPGGFSGGRGSSGPEQGADFGREKRGYGGFHNDGPYIRNFGEIHGLDSFRPAQGVGLDPPMLPMLGLRRKNDEAKEVEFRDAEREAFEAELEREQKTQELDRQRKLEEKERAVEIAQKEIEERERQAREEEERQAKLEEEAKEAAARAEREALEAAQKVEDERKAREDEKRQMQLEEERRKENAHRKLLELEERIAKREAEKKQQEEARQNEEERPVNVWQAREEEEVRRREDVEREEEERLVASITGNDQDDDDRAPLRPSRASQRSVQDDIPSRVKSPEVQPPSMEPTSRVAEFRGGNTTVESERRTFVPWRREHPGDNGNGSAAPQIFHAHGRDDNADFQASVSRDRVYNNRGYGDRGDSFYSGGPSSVGFPSEGGPGEFPRRPHFAERRWPAEEPGYPSKQMGLNRATTPDFEGGYLESSGERDERRWGRDRADRWRSGREGPGQRLSPPRTPPYFQGSDTTEPSSYGRLRQSLPKQPRVPPPPARMNPQRPPPRFSSEQTFLAGTLAKDDEARGGAFQQELAVESKSNFSRQEDSDNQQAEDPALTRTGADVRREEVLVQPSKGWGPPQRDWQQFPSSSLRPQRSFAQVSQGPSHEDAKVQLPTPSQERNSLPAEEESPPTNQTQSEEESDQKEAVVSLATSEVDKQESELPVEEQDFDGEEDERQTDEEEEDDDQEGDEEGYEGYDEEDDEEDDDEDEVDEVDREEVRELAEQSIDSTMIGHEGGNKEGFTAVGFDERITEIGVGGNDDDDEGDEVLLNQPVEYDYTEQSQKNVEMEDRPMPQEGTEQSSLRPSAAGSTTESDAYDVRHPSPSQSQPPLSFMAFSMPQANVIPISSSQLTSVPLPSFQNSSEVPLTLQFGLLPGTSLLQGSVPAIQIGSIQMPLHVPPHMGLQQVTHVSSTQTPLFQFGQLGYQNPLPQSLPTFGQHSQAANVSTQSQAQVADLQAVLKASQEQQETTLPEASVQVKREEDSISLHPQSPWMNQYVSVDVKASVEVETRETRFNPGRPGPRPERRPRDRGGPREGLNNIAGQESYPRVKSVRREPGTQRSFEEAGASQANDMSYTEAPCQGSSADSSILDPLAGAEDPWRRPLGGRGRGLGSRGGGMLGRGNLRSGSHSGRNVSQSPVESTSTSAGISTPYVGADGVILRSRSSRRSNFRRSEFKGRDSIERDSAGGRPYWQTANASTEMTDIADGRDGSRETAVQRQERGYSGVLSHSSRAAAEGRSPPQTGPRPERTSSSETFQKNGGRGSGTSGGLARSGEGLLGKYSSETAPDAPLQSGVVHVFKQPGIEVPSDEDDFIEVRSKRQMLNDRREQREKEIKAKSKDMKAKEQAARKQRGSAKSGSQVEGSAGKGNKTAGVIERRTSSTSTDNVSNTARPPQPGTPPPGAVSSVTTPIGTSQALPLAPIGTPAGGSSEKQVKLSKSSQSNSASGGSLGDVEIGAVSATSESQSLPQESMSGMSIAWGGTRCTRQVVSLTQIQLEEAMKPVRYEAPVPQQLPLGERGSMVLDPGTTVASMAGKEKMSVSATGPIGSLLAGDKIQFGAVTSPPLAMPNSRPHTPGLISAVGSSLASRVEGVADENDLKISKHISCAELDVPSFPTKGKRTRGQEEMGGTDGGIDAEAEAEAAASAVAVAAISSDESVGSTREPTISIRKTTIKNSFTSVTSTTNQSGLGMGNAMPVHMQAPMMEDSMAAALPADLSVEPTSMSIRGSAGQGSSLLSTSGQSPFSALEVSQMLGGQIFPFGPSKDVSGPQGSNDQGVPSVSPSGGGWQPQHSGVDSYYGGPPPSGYTGQFINPGAGMPPPHMLVYTNPFAPVGQFGQLGFMGPTYLPSGKQPDWKHTPVWSSGPGVVGMSASDSLGGMMGGQRGAGNIQRMAPGPAVMPVAPPPGPFDLNLSAPFQIPNVDTSMQSQWSHVPAPLHNVPMSGPLMGYAMQQSRRAPPHPMDNSGGYNLGPSSNQVNSGNFSSMDAAAQFPDELGLGDTSSSVPSSASHYGGVRNSGRGPVSNQAAPMSSSAQGNNKLRSNRRSSRVSRGGNLMGSGNGSNSGTINQGMGVNSGGYGNVGANGGRVPPNHMQSQTQLQQQQGMGGMGQPHPQHAMNYSDQRGPSQQSSPRVGPANNWSGGQGHRKGAGPQGRPPIGERGPSGDKMFAPSSKLKQVYVAKPSSSPRRSGGDACTAIFNGTEAGQAAMGL